MTLGVSRAGYYEWKKGPTSTRALRHGRGIAVGHNTVAMLMRRLEIRGLPARQKKRGAKISVITSLDLVRREFARTAPDQLWLADITEHSTS